MGRRQWETVVANATRQSLVATKQSNITLPTISKNGGVYTNDFFPPAGYIAVVQSMYLALSGKTPAELGATSGTLYIKVGTAVSSGSAIAATYSKDKGIGDLFNHMQWYGAQATEPNDISGVVQSLRGYTFDANIGLRLAIFNNTDVDLTGLKIAYWYVNWLKIESA